jgi:hypothetical protein
MFQAVSGAAFEYRHFQRSSAHRREPSRLIRGPLCVCVMLNDLVNHSFPYVAILKVDQGVWRSCLWIDGGASLRKLEG